MKKLYLVTFKKRALVSTLLIALTLVIIANFISFLPDTYMLAQVRTIFSDGHEPDKEEFLLEEGKLAIIIDDFGSSRRGVDEMMAINRHLTFAVMPFLENSESDALTAQERGFEVIVHLPLEPNHGKISWLGPKPILAGMKGDEVRKIVMESFDNIPQAAGANIHMGSKASSEEGIVATIVDVIKEKNLYFVDSRTADHPIGKKVSDEKGVLCYDRDVFLDGQQPKEYIKKRLGEAGNIALKKGYAVAIGHVGIEGGKATADAISEMLPEFDKRNIRLVFVSELSK